jgi:hypothetical protein
MIRSFALKVAVYLLQRYATRDVVREAIDDAFAIVRNQVVSKTPTAIDDRAIDAIERSIDKDKLADFLSVRLVDLLNRLS